MCDAPSGAATTVGIPDAPLASPEHSAAEPDATMETAEPTAALDDTAVFPDTDASETGVVIDGTAVDTVGADIVQGAPTALNVLTSPLGVVLAALSTDGTAENAAVVAGIANMPIAVEAEGMD